MSLHVDIDRRQLLVIPFVMSIILHVPGGFFSPLSVDLMESIVLDQWRSGFSRWPRELEMTQKRLSLRVARKKINRTASVIHDDDVCAKRSELVC